MPGKSWKENLSDKEKEQRRKSRNKRKTYNQKLRSWGKGRKK